MEAYIYNADIYCIDCALEESDGPYPDGGGEADSPRHCGQCGVFLENPLTRDGVEYVRQALDDDTGDATVLRVWHDYYRERL